MEKTIGLGRKIAITSRQRNVDKSRGSSTPYLYYVMLQFAFWFVSRNCGFLQELFLGDKGERAERSIGSNGTNFVNQRHMAKWGLRIYQGSLMHYWQSKHDVSYMIQHRFFYRVFKAKFFPNGTIMEVANPSSASHAW